MNNFAEILAILGSMIGVIGGVSAGVFWYRGSVTKEYAAKRDFNHLMNNYDQMNQNIEHLASDQDSRFDRVDLNMNKIEVKLDTALQAFRGRSSWE